MGFFLGIDGGGTHTRYALGDESGALVGDFKGAPSNVRRVSEERLRTILTSGVQGIELLGASTRDILAVGAGFAGVSDSGGRERARQILSQLLPQSRLYLVGDMEVALEAAVGAGPGLVVLAGTGSIAYGRNAQGQTARAGGEGPRFSATGEMIGDLGSGTHFGWRLWQAAREVATGKEIQSSLAPYLADLARVTAGKAWDEFAAEVMDFAGLTDVVRQAAEQGDEWASSIVEDAAEALAALALDVLRALGLADQQVEVAMAGGVLTHVPPLQRELRRRIVSAVPQANVVPLLLSPARGGVRLARRLWLEEQQGGR